MDPRRWEQVQELLAEALELPADERDAFLDECCGGDEAVRAEVRSLLEASERADGYFESLGERAGIGSNDSLAPDAPAAQQEPGQAAADGAREARPASLLGHRVSRYRVTGTLGEGGMGKVYRAVDPELHREVALKVLPGRLAGDTTLAARLQREARVLASLNHSNIGAIYGLEEIEGRRALVLELVEGPTLAERIGRRPLGLDDAVEVAMQVAEALESAHALGVVHRDLKPGNIKLTPDGRVKVLDFGIAKALARETEADTDPDRSPSEQLASTAAGRVLGTVAYMSPEQARGKRVDARTDIWALGCVLYEMLTGHKAFEGETSTDTLAAVIHEQPDWTALPRRTPASLRRLLRRCLEKDRQRRLRHAGDVWLELDEIRRALADGTAETGPVAAGRGRGAWPWAAAALLGVAGLGLALGWWLAPEPPAPVRRLEVALPGGPVRPTLGGRLVALSSDGDVLAHTAGVGVTLRALDSFSETVLADTLGAESPFFSPDGEWVGYFARGSVWKVSVRGGSPFRLCNATIPRGAFWDAGGEIVFSDGTALWTVDGDGGPCTVLAEPPEGSGSRYVWPAAVPGGVVFERAGESGGGIVVLDRDTGELGDVVAGGSDPRYLPTGHLLMARETTLFVVPFDAGARVATGSPRPVVTGVRTESTGAAHVAVGGDGSMVYVPTPEPGHELVWVDRQGNEEPLALERGDYTTPRVSPDGTRVALVARRGGERQVWIHDVERGTLRQLTVEGTNIWPDWAPDGRRVVFASGRAGPSNLWWKEVDGAGAAEALTRERRVQYVTSLSRDPAVVAYFQVSPEGSRDIWVMPLEGERRPRPAVASPSAHEQGPALSPDARWIAYVSDESGRNEVYLRPCSACSGAAATGDRRQWQISSAGGGEPVWSPDGTEITYREGTRLMAVDLGDGSDPAPSRPRLLFDGTAHVVGQSGNSNYDVAPDGRFLVVKGSGTDPERPRVNVVLNWLSGLRDEMSAADDG